MISNARTYLSSLGPSRMNFNLERMRKLVRALGNPQDKFPAVHIAGTNGKGSVAMMVANTLWESKIRAGLYTSPHLSDLTERFQINGRKISEQDLSRLTRKIRRTLRTGRLGFRTLTQFEFLTAIAFLWFAEKKVQLAVVEVGLGGRLDATNVLGKVFVTVITTIGKDHTQWLGTTIRKIAGEKAGIIKPGIPVVTGTSGEALRVIERQASRLGAPVFVLAAKDFIRNKIGPLRTLKGRYQQLNGSLAYAALNLLTTQGFSLSKWGIIHGIRNAEWPGRYEEFRIRVGRKIRRVILDGAHNPEAARALVQAFRTRERGRAVFLFSALKDKDINSIVRHLAPLAEEVIITDVPSDRMASPGLMACHPAWKKKTAVIFDPEFAFEQALQRKPNLPLVVTGSLYLIGAIRPLLKGTK